MFFKVINVATKAEVFRSKSHKCCASYITQANQKWRKHRAKFEFKLNPFGAVAKEAN